MPREPFETADLNRAICSKCGLFSRAFRRPKRNETTGETELVLITVCCGASGSRPPKPP